MEPPNPIGPEYMGNVYHLLPTDKRDLLLVPFALFGSTPLMESNYDTWRQQMLTVLTYKNKHGFVDGTVRKPSDTDPRLAIWFHRNGLVLSWIQNSVSPIIANSLSHFTSAAEMWMDLQRCFSRATYSADCVRRLHRIPKVPLYQFDASERFYMCRSCRTHLVAEGNCLYEVRILVNIYLTILLFKVFFLFLVSWKVKLISVWSIPGERALM